MKKDGDWIATFGADLRVSRVMVEPSPALDLVEVKIVDPVGKPAGVYFFDRVEAQELANALTYARADLCRAEREGPA